MVKVLPCWILLLPDCTFGSEGIGVLNTLRNSHAKQDTLGLTFFLYYITIKVPETLQFSFKKIQNLNYSVGATHLSISASITFFED